MNNIKLNYLVLYSSEIELLREFYELMGFIFQKEKHDSGPEHYSTLVEEIVLEIYPTSDKNIGKQRLGFIVDNLELIVNSVETRFPFSVESFSETTAVIIDPDYRLVELINKC